MITDGKGAFLVLESKGVILALVEFGGKLGEKATPFRATRFKLITLE